MLSQTSRLSIRRAFPLRAISTRTRPAQILHGKPPMSPAPAAFVSWNRAQHASVDPHGTKWSMPSSQFIDSEVTLQHVKDLIHDGDDVRLFLSPSLLQTSIYSVPADLLELHFDRCSRTGRVQSRRDPHGRQYSA